MKFKDAFIKLLILFAFFPVAALASDCKGILGNNVLTLLQQAYNIIKYLAVILLLVLSTIDYIRAVASQDKDLLKKASISAATRLGIAVVIFLLPTLIKIILMVFGVSTEGTCGIM